MTEQPSITDIDSALKASTVEIVRLRSENERLRTELAEAKGLAEELGLTERVRDVAIRAGKELKGALEYLSATTENARFLWDQQGSPAAVALRAAIITARRALQSGRGEAPRLKPGTCTYHREAHPACPACPPPGAESREGAPVAPRLGPVWVISNSDTRACSVCHESVDLRSIKCSACATPAPKTFTVAEIEAALDAMREAWCNQRHWSDESGPHFEYDLVDPFRRSLGIDSGEGR